MPRRTSPATDPTVIEIVDAVRRIIRIFRLSSRGAERELGISGAQLFVLERLAERPDASLNDLAERTLTDQSTVSVVVARLVRRGLVRRRRSRADSRRLELALTPAGRALLRGSPMPMQVRLIEALARLRRTERTRLAVLLQQVVAAMGAAHEPATLIFDTIGPAETPAAGRRRAATKRPRRQPAPLRRVGRR